jgi:hypothetical protein
LKLQTNKIYHPECGFSFTWRGYFWQNHLSKDN